MLKSMVLNSWVHFPAFRKTTHNSANVSPCYLIIFLICIYFWVYLVGRKIIFRRLFCNFSCLVLKFFENFLYKNKFLKMRYNKRIKKNRFNLLKFYICCLLFTFQYVRLH